MHWTVILNTPREGFPGSTVVKNSPANSGDMSERRGFDPGTKKILWSRKREPTPVCFPGKVHGQRSLGGYSLWGCKDTTECVHTHARTYIPRKSPRQCDGLLCSASTMRWLVGQGNKQNKVNPATGNGSNVSFL